jgi:hypothetical protein
MSAWGQKRTLAGPRVMSALAPEADVKTRPADVRYVPGTDIACIVFLTSTTPRGRYLLELERFERLFYLQDAGRARSMLDSCLACRSACDFPNERT